MNPAEWKEQSVECKLRRREEAGAVEGRGQGGRWQEVGSERRQVL